MRSLTFPCNCRNLKLTVITPLVVSAFVSAFCLALKFWVNFADSEAFEMWLYYNKYVFLYCHRVSYYVLLKGCSEVVSFETGDLCEDRSYSRIASCAILFMGCLVFNLVALFQSSQKIQVITNIASQSERAAWKIHVHAPAQYNSKCMMCSAVLQQNICCLKANNAEHSTSPPR